jgi:hypothetical protein
MKRVIAERARGKATGSAASPCWDRVHACGALGIGNWVLRLTTVVEMLL